MKTSATGWSEVCIGDLGQVLTGRTPPSERPGLFGDIYPFITPGDMHQGKYARKTERRLSREGASFLGRIQLPANSVCVSCIGWQMGEVILTDRNSFSNQQINTIVPSDNYDASFLYYSFRLRKHELLSLGSAAGARTPILNKSAFCNLKIRVPELPLQQRIASILGAYDDLIEINELRIARLDEMARRLFDEWFVKFRFPGAEPMQLDNQRGTLPVGWTWTTLGSLARRHTDPYVPRHHETYPLLDLARMPRRSAVIAEFGHPDELTTSRIVAQPHDVLFAVIRPNLHKVVAAPSALVTNVSVHVIRAQSSEYQPFLWAALTRDWTVAWATQHANGTKMPTLPWDVFSKFPLPMPAPILIERFKATVEPMMEAIATSIFCNQRLAAARDLLLPRLISGELSVLRAERELAAAA